LTDPAIAFYPVSHYRGDDSRAGNLQQPEDKGIRETVFPPRLTQGRPLHYLDRAIPHELSLGVCGLVVALLMNGGCVTHQMTCQLDDRSCLTRQTLALDAMESLREAGPLTAEDISQLIHPLLQGQGYVQIPPIEESWTWLRAQKNRQESSSLHVHIVIPGPETPCFLSALPQWLQWSRELPAKIDGAVSLSTSKSSVLESKEVFHLILACGSLPTTLELTVPSSPDGTAIEPWFEELKKSNLRNETLVIRSPNTGE